MKTRKDFITNVLMLLAAILVFGMSGCGSIKIQSPSKDGLYITNDHNLKVAHRGCGRIEPETFRAVLDQGSSEEKDLTSFFSYTNSTWSTSGIDLPLESHIVSASADLKRPSGLGGFFCWFFDNKDTRKFSVVKAMCPEGRIIDENAPAPLSEIESLTKTGIFVCLPK